MNQQIPTVGRTVHYRLSADDAETIKSRRKAAYSDLSGGTVKTGDVCPMVIVRVWGETTDCAVNGHVLLDGFDTLWVSSVVCGEGPRTYSWPPRV